MCFPEFCGSFQQVVDIKKRSSEPWCIGNQSEVQVTTWGLLIGVRSRGGGQSCGIWSELQVDSVRMELNCRTPGWAHGIALCGKPTYLVSEVLWASQKCESKRKHWFPPAEVLDPTCWESAPKPVNSCFSSLTFYLFIGHSQNSFLLPGHISRSPQLKYSVIELLFVQ